MSHPVQVDARGRFLSRDLANGNTRRKRDIGGTGFKEPVFFKLSAFGQDFHLNVTINDELFSPNFEIEIRSNGSSEFHYEIDHCHYIGQLLPAEGKGNKVAVSNCDGLVRSFDLEMCLHERPILKTYQRLKWLKFVVRVIPLFFFSHRKVWFARHKTFSWYIHFRTVWNWGRTAPEPTLYTGGLYHLCMRSLLKRLSKKRKDLTAGVEWKVLKTTYFESLLYDLNFVNVPLDNYDLALVFAVYLP